MSAESRAADAYGIPILTAFRIIAHVAEGIRAEYGEDALVQFYTSVVGVRILETGYHFELAPWAAQSPRINQRFQEAMKLFEK